MTIQKFNQLWQLLGSIGKMDIDKEEALKLLQDFGIVEIDKKEQDNG